MRREGRRVPDDHRDRGARAVRHEARGRAIVLHRSRRGRTLGRRRARPVPPLGRHPAAHVHHGDRRAGPQGHGFPRVRRRGGVRRRTVPLAGSLGLELAPIPPASSACARTMATCSATRSCSTRSRRSSRRARCAAATTPRSRSGWRSRSWSWRVSRSRSTSRRRQVSRQRVRVRVLGATGHGGQEVLMRAVAATASGGTAHVSLGCCPRCAHRRRRQPAQGRPTSRYDAERQRSGRARHGRHPGLASGADMTADGVFVGVG